MASKKDTKKIKDTEVKETSTDQFTSEEWAAVARHIHEDFRKRRDAKARKSAERQWKEVDRQIAMIPDRSKKVDSAGRSIPENAWMPEMELPLMSIALEVLSADLKKMLFPDSGNFFTAHTETTDEYLKTASEDVLIPGDQMETPSLIAQDNADKLTEGIHIEYMRQGEFEQHVDDIMKESLKYNIGVGRAKTPKKHSLTQRRGAIDDKDEVPVLVPRSIKHIYPDFSRVRVLNENLMISDSVIDAQVILRSDLVLAADSGSRDPNKDNGGWMPEAIEGLTGDEDGYIEILEYEGDLVMGKEGARRSIVIKNGIFTVAVSGTGDKQVERVIRFRRSDLEQSSYLFFIYNKEQIEDPYASSVLMTAAPIQASASEMLNRMLMSAALETQPVLTYDPSDMTMQAQQGPKVYPGAQIATLGTVDVLNIGNSNEMFNIYSGLLAQFANITGITPARLGAPTKSHTTRFAKEAEIVQGQSRTVAFARSVMRGPLKAWLELQHKLIMKVFKGRKTFYIDEYGGYVDISKKSIPKNVTFSVFGAGNPVEEEQQIARRFASAQQAIQLETLRLNAGMPPKIDIGALIEQTLREGGWTDTDAIMLTDTSQGQVNAATGGPAVPGTSGALANAVPIALQTLGSTEL